MEKSFGRLRVIKALGKSKLEFDNKIHRDGKDFLGSVIPGFAVRCGQFHLCPSTLIYLCRICCYSSHTKHFPPFLIINSSVSLAFLMKGF